MIDAFVNNYIANNMDLVIAAGMVVVGLLVLLVSKYKSMPSKGMPYILGAILGVVGITMFNRAKAKRLKKEVQQLEGQIADRLVEIEAAAKDLERREELLEQARLEHAESVKRYKKNTLSYIKSPEEIEKLSDEDVFAEFDRI